jgi:crossover junction endodeoxyribonuclease RusA
VEIQSLESDTMTQITVRGNPAPQGSKRHIGHGVMIESSQKVKPWREAVKWAAIEVLRDTQPFKGPVCLDITFTLRKPKSAPKRQRTYPDKQPDIDKLCRSTLDALVASEIIEDDSRVVRLVATKVFPGESFRSLGCPGAVIRIATMFEADALSAEEVA